MACQLQREIGFYAGADIEWPARIDRPTAFGELLVQHVLGALRGNRVSLAAQPGQQQDVFAFEDRIAFQLADPVAIGVLFGQEPLPRAGDRLAKLRDIALSGGGRGAGKLLHSRREGLAGKQLSVRGNELE